MRTVIDSSLVSEAGVSEAVWLPILVGRGSVGVGPGIWSGAAGADCLRSTPPLDTDVTTLVYPGARHEIFNETDKERVLHDVTSFIDRTLFPQPA